MNPESNPPSRGAQGFLKEDCVTVLSGSQSQAYAGDRRTTHWFFGWKTKVTVSPTFASTCAGLKARPSFPTSTRKSSAAARPTSAEAKTKVVVKRMMGANKTTEASIKERQKLEATTGSATRWMRKHRRGTHPASGMSNEWGRGKWVTRIGETPTT
jgi:hypothetical protein